MPLIMMEVGLRFHKQEVLMIEDNVDIGANTTIDCGAIDDTTIKIRSKN